MTAGDLDPQGRPKDGGAERIERATEMTVPASPSAV
jgi:hypothetical protein